MPHARTHQQVGRDRSQRPAARQHGSRTQQLFLPGFADPREENLPRVFFNLFAIHRVFPSVNFMIAPFQARQATWRANLSSYPQGECELQANQGICEHAPPAGPRPGPSGDCLPASFSRVPLRAPRKRNLKVKRSPKFASWMKPATPFRKRRRQSRSKRETFLILELSAKASESSTARETTPISA